MNQFIVVLAGQFGVGKTLIFRILKDHYRNNITTQAKDACEFTLSMNDINVKITLRDTAGMERHSKLTDSYFRNANVLIVVYKESAECDQTSLLNVRDWVNASGLNPEGVVIAVWGNVMGGHTRDPDDTTAQCYLTSLAKLYNIPPYLVCSFRVEEEDYGQRLAEAFEDIIESLLVRKRDGTLDIVNDERVIISEDSTKQTKCKC